MKLTDRPRVYVQRKDGLPSCHYFTNDESAALWLVAFYHLPGVKAVLRKAGDERPVEQADWEGVRS